MNRYCFNFKDEKIKDVYNMRVNEKLIYVFFILICSFKERNIFKDIFYE